MKRPALPRRSVAWIVFTALALVTHTACGHFLAGRDIFASLLGARDTFPALCAVLLVSSRLFLYLLAPGWALHIAVRTLLERRPTPGHSPRSRPPGGGDVPD